MTQALDLKITTFQLFDAPQLIEVINSVCADTPWMKTRRFEPTLAWQYALENEDCSDHLLALVRVDGQVIGWCRLFPPSIDQPHVIELGIGVLRPYRGQGVGTMMMQYAMRWARVKTIATITLTTHIQNTPAIYLFKKCGFVERGEKDHQLRMNLELNTRPKVIQNGL